MHVTCEQVHGRNCFYLQRTLHYEFFYPMLLNNHVKQFKSVHCIAKLEYPNNIVNFKSVANENIYSNESVNPSFR